MRKLISKAQLQRRIRELAAEIDTQYAGKELVLLGLLNGSLFFMVDLIRAMKTPVIIECWRLRSYSGTGSTGKIEGLKEGFGDFKGKHVLIVDDILDTGLTLHTVKQRMLQLGAKSVKICVMLDKQKKRVPRIQAQFSAFQIQDEFVIGYGLDYNGKYRELPDIRIYEP